MLSVLVVLVVLTVLMGIPKGGGRALPQPIFSTEVRGSARHSDEHEQFATTSRQIDEHGFTVMSVHRTVAKMGNREHHAYPSLDHERRGQRSLSTRKKTADAKGLGVDGAGTVATDSDQSSIGMVGC